MDADLLYDAWTWPDENTAKARVDNSMSEAELISYYKSTIQATSVENVATTMHTGSSETTTIPTSTDKEMATSPTNGPVVPSTKSNIQATSNAEVLLITICVTAALCLLISIVGCGVFYFFIARRRLQHSKRNSVALMRMTPRNPHIVGDWVFAQRPPTPVTPARQTPVSTPPVRRVITVGNNVAWPSPYFGGNRRARSDVVSLRNDTESHRSHTGYDNRNGSELGTDDKRIVVWPRRQ